MARQRYFVYHLRDTSGLVIYVGSTCQLTRRIETHIERPWGADIARIDLFPQGSDIEAARSEVADIARLQPVHNIAATGRTRAPNRKRYLMVIDALESGPKTQSEVMQYFKAKGVDDVDTVSITLRRLLARGEVAVVGERPPIRGRHTSTRVYGLPGAGVDGILPTGVGSVT